MKITKYWIFLEWKKLSALEGIWDPFQKNLIQFLRLTVRAIFADDSYSQQPIQGALEKSPNEKI